MDEKQTSVWLIHFADGTVASSCGTEENAQEFAELKKSCYGGNYILKEDDAK